MDLDYRDLVDTWIMESPSNHHLFGMNKFYRARFVKIIQMIPLTDTDSGQRTADSGQRTADSGQRTAKIKGRQGNMITAITT